MPKPSQKLKYWSMMYLILNIGQLSYLIFIIFQPNSLQEVLYLKFLLFFLFLLVFLLNLDLLFHLRVITSVTSLIEACKQKTSYETLKSLFQKITFTTKTMILSSRGRLLFLIIIPMFLVASLIGNVFILDSSIFLIQTFLLGEIIVICFQFWHSYIDSTSFILLLQSNREHLSHCEAKLQQNKFTFSQAHVKYLMQNLSDLITETDQIEKEISTLFGKYKFNLSAFYANLIQDIQTLQKYMENFYKFNGMLHTFLRFTKNQLFDYHAKFQQIRETERIQKQSQFLEQIHQQTSLFNSLEDQLKARIAQTQEDLESMLGFVEEKITIRTQEMMNSFENQQNDFIKTLESEYTSVSHRLQSQFNILESELQKNYETHRNTIHTQLTHDITKIEKKIANLEDQSNYSQLVLNMAKFTDFLDPVAFKSQLFLLQEVIARQVKKQPENRLNIVKQLTTLLES